MGDEHLYLQAAQELDSGHIREGLWAKAMCEAAFDRAIARPIYTKLVVVALKQESRESAVRSALPFVVRWLGYLAGAAILGGVVILAAALYLSWSNKNHYPSPGFERRSESVNSQERGALRPAPR